MDSNYKIAIEINGQRFETESNFLIEGIEDILVEAKILEEGDSLTVLERDEDYILHRY